MKFIINSESLFKAGEMIKKVIATKTVVPIIENFMVTVNKATVTVTGTNLQSTFEVELPAGSVQYDGAPVNESFLVPAVQVLKHLKGIKQPVTIQPINSANPGIPYKVSITDDDGTATFASDTTNDFPRVPEVDNGLVWSMVTPFDQFEDSMKYILKDDSRPAMSSLYFESVAGNLVLVATDGYRVRTHKTNEPCAKSFLMHRDAVKLLQPFKPVATVVTVNDSHVRFAFSSGEFHVRFTTRVIDERFPDYKNVIPDKAGAKVVADLDRKEFIKQLGKARNFANASTEVVALHLNGKLELSASDLDYNHNYTGKLAGTKTGGDIRIGFKAPYLADMLNTFEGATVQTYLTEPSRCGVFTGGSNTEVLIMPYKID